MTEVFFVDSCEDMNELNFCVTENINFCEKRVCTKKDKVIYPNNKPWVNKRLTVLLNEKKIMSAREDQQGLKAKQKEIEEEIKNCRQKYKTKLEKSFASGNMRETWKGMKTISNYIQRKSLSTQDMDLNELDKFYVRFDDGDFKEEIYNMKQDLFNPVQDEDGAEFESEQTRRVLPKVNERKACGADGIKGKIFKSHCRSVVLDIYRYF